MFLQESGWLFNAYMVLAYLALVCFGGASLAGRALPAWLGWAAMVFGASRMLSMITSQPKIMGFPLFERPAMIHVMSLVMGITLPTMQVFTG